MDYDNHGSPLRSLDSVTTAGARAGELGEEDVARAASMFEYDDRGNQVAQIGPMHDALVAGEMTPVRTRARSIFDEGAPAGEEPFDLPTTEVSEVIDGSGTVVEEVSRTRTRYDWASLDVTATTQAAGPTLNAADITRTMEYDSDHRVVASSQPLSNGSDAGTTRTRYYTAGPHPSEAACGDRPEWEDLVCRTHPAAQPVTGPTLPDTRYEYAASLGVATAVETSGSVTRTRTVTFDGADRPASVRVASSIAGSSSQPGTVVGYSTTTGEVAYTALRQGDGSAHPTRRVTTTTDGWGRPTSYTNDFGQSTTTSYDTAGRVASITDPYGSRSYTWDGADAAGHTERRGLPTSMTVTRAGGDDLVFTGAYDARGLLTREDLPGGVVRRTGYDGVGSQGDLSYSGQVTPVTESTDEAGERVWTPGTPVADQPWLAWTRQFDGGGRVARQFNGAGAGFDGVPGVTDPTDPDAPSVGRALAADLAYTYDHAGRLTQVLDRAATVTGQTLTPETDASAAAPCQRRSYTFDANGRRTALDRVTDVGGVCPSGQPTAGQQVESSTYGYDQADRPTTGVNGQGAYVYDAFGRQTTVPAADLPASDGSAMAGDVTVGYFDDDQVATITRGGQTTTFELDPNGRRRVQSAHSGVVTENHYGDGGDSPMWTTTRPGVGQAGATTRHVPGLGGGVAVQLSDAGRAELVVADSAGNNVTTIPVTGNGTAATGITAWTMYDEYGTVTTGQQPASGYGHLGQYQRATSDTHGLTLMGRRLYNPARAAFTSTDPIPGGNENPYNYPNDPINNNDTSGMLNVPEVALCAANPYLCTRAKAISNMAIRLTEGGRYLPRTENAIRHFIWQATLTVELGATWAKAWGDAHEVGSKDARDSRIDLSNNWRARWWATRTMSRLKEIRREGRERMMRYLRWKAETLVRSGFLR